MGPSARPPYDRAADFSVGRCGTDELNTEENDRGVRVGFSGGMREDA